MHPEMDGHGRPDAGEPSVELVDRVPTTEELRLVAQSVGWLDHFDWAEIGVALGNSLHGVVAVLDGRIVGVARLVGDGVRYFYVQDVMVDPAVEGRGIATALVERLLTWIRRGAASERVVGLFASPDAVDVYDGLGFRAATADPLGMTLSIGGAEGDGWRS